MRRLTPLILAAFAVAAASCSDTATAPRQQVERPAFSVTSSSNAARSFVIDNAAGERNFGQFDLTWGANAIACVGNPCVAPDGPVTVSVKTQTLLGWHFIDFTPHVEFNPGTTVISTRQFAPIVRQLNRFGVPSTNSIWDLFVIRHAAAIGDTTESFATAKAATHIDLNTGIVSREVDHFSGYVVATGKTCDPSTDPNCTTSSGSGTTGQQ